jgi:hypothetical protein
MLALLPHSTWLNSVTKDLQWNFLQCTLSTCGYMNENIDFYESMPYTILKCLQQNCQKERFNYNFKHLRIGK